MVEVLGEVVEVLVDGVDEAMAVVYVVCEDKVSDLKVPVHSNELTNGDKIVIIRHSKCFIAQLWYLVIRNQDI